MNRQDYLDLDRSFFHLSWVQQGAVLALAQAIFTHQGAGRNVSIADASLIIREVENQAPAGWIFGQLVAAKWFIGGTGGIGVLFFSRDVEDYLVIKLAQMILVRIQEKAKEAEETTGRKPRRR